MFRIDVEMEIETRILTSTHFPEVLGNFYAVFPILISFWNKNVKYVYSFRVICYNQVVLCYFKT